MELTNVDQKLDALRARLRDMGSVLVALSGGVDSSLVAFVACQELGGKALAVTSGSSSLKRDDLQLTRAITAEWGMAHEIIETAEIDNPDYARNPVNRCYHCKSTLYKDLDQIARTRGIAYVVNGNNLDDMGDHRPGLTAASEYGVRSPLVDCGFRKADIRSAAQLLGLRNAGKPQAACLASRVPYGVAVSRELLGRIEQAERAVAELGFSQYRVRHHGDVARLELAPAEFGLAVERHEDLVAAIKSCGWTFVALDLEGFRSGSLNHSVARTIPLVVAH